MKHKWDDYMGSFFILVKPGYMRAKEYSIELNALQLNTFETSCKKQICCSNLALQNIRRKRFRHGTSLGIEMQNIIEVKRNKTMCTILCRLKNFADNFTTLMASTKEIQNDILFNAFISVDSFLFISGVLLAYIFYKEMDRNPRKMKNPVYWILFYVHRILR